MTEDEMVGWHHRLDGHEFEQGPGVGDGQGSLACCSPWGCKESDMTEHTHTGDQYMPPQNVNVVFQNLLLLSYNSHVQLFVTPWNAACQAPLSSTFSWSLLDSCPLSQ